MMRAFRLLVLSAGALLVLAGLAGVIIPAWRARR